MVRGNTARPLVRGRRHSPTAAIGAGGFPLPQPLPFVNMESIGTRQASHFRQIFEQWLASMSVHAWHIFYNLQ